MKKLSPLKCIRLKCLDCSITSKEVRLCPVTDCSLYTYRFGHNPSRKNKGNANVLMQYRVKKRSCVEEKTQNSTDFANSTDTVQK